MIPGVIRLFRNLLSTTADVLPTLTATTILDQTGAAATAALVTALGLATIDTFLQCRQGKKLSELQQHFRHLLVISSDVQEMFLGEARGKDGAAELVAKLEAIDTGTIPAEDTRFPYLVFYRWIKGEYENAKEEFHEQLLNCQTAVIKQVNENEALQKRILALIVKLSRALESLMDLNGEQHAEMIAAHQQLRASLEVNREETLRELGKLMPSPQLSLSVLSYDPRLHPYSYRVQRVPLAGREAELCELRTFLLPSPTQAIGGCPIGC